MSASIDRFLLLLLLLLAFLFLHHHHHPVLVTAQPAVPTSHITVVGVVFCDTCSFNTFSRHSYFLPGADVLIQCKFQANSPKTNEQINFSVTRTTDKHGVYKLEIPHVDGVDCVEGMAIESLCQASLIGSTTSACNVPGLRTATNEISVKSKQDSLCIYSLKALSYRPSKKNVTLCGNHRSKSLQNTTTTSNSKESFQLQRSTFNSSKHFLPYYLPPYGIIFPQLPPSLPKPPFTFPNSWPFPSPPPLPFPFPPPPAFNLGDPRTWIPNIPLLSPPPPPAFNPLDPRTWIPHFPPSPPTSTSQSQNP